MPNLEIAAVTMSLVQIEDELRVTTKRVEKEQWRIAELLWGAREHFDENDDKGFKKWVSEKTGYTYQTVGSHIKTYLRFKDNKLIGSNQKSDNPIPFSKLEPLAAEKVPHRVVQSTVEKLVSKNPPTEKQVRQTAREAKPGYIKPEDRGLFMKAIPDMRPEFSVRAKNALNAGKHFSPVRVLDISIESNVETIKLVAKHWKQKYHPDREDGNAEIFQLINKCETAMLERRGVK